VFRVERACLKWKVGFNTEITEGTEISEKRSRDERRLSVGVGRIIPSQEFGIK
jgi:hypothetical protein